jgi:hypothetical protein
MILFCHGNNCIALYNNAPIERFEDHYRVNFFLPFIDHTISHLNSRFTQGRKAIFYGNYLVSALVNNVNSEIVNDMKTEYMNDLPYQNHLPQEGDRWGCKMYLLQLTDSQISYADTDLYPNVHVILKLYINFFRFLYY